MQRLCILEPLICPTGLVRCWAPVTPCGRDGCFSSREAQDEVFTKHMDWAVLLLGWRVKWGGKPVWLRFPRILQFWQMRSMETGVDKTGVCRGAALQHGFSPEDCLPTNHVAGFISLPIPNSVRIHSPTPCVPLTRPCSGSCTYRTFRQKERLLLVLSEFCLPSYAFTSISWDAIERNPVQYRFGQIVSSRSFLSYMQV